LKTKTTSPRSPGERGRILLKQKALCDSRNLGMHAAIAGEPNGQDREPSGSKLRFCWGGKKKRNWGDEEYFAGYGRFRKRTGTCGVTVV